MTSIGAIFTSTYHTKQLNPWQTHQPVLWWITASCLFAKGVWSHLKATRALVDLWQASDRSHSKSSQDNFQPQYWPELLVNVYSYRLMVKSVFCCCVRGRRLFSNLVINVTRFAKTRHNNAFWKSRFCISGFYIPKTLFCSNTNAVFMVRNAENRPLRINLPISLTY